MVYSRAKGTFEPLDLNAVYRVVGNAFTIVESGDGFSMFRGAKVVENGLATDYLVLAEYAKAFAKGEDGMPRIATATTPLAKLPNYPIAYEKPSGAGRISFKGLAQ
jgi:2',3'-cyclic-nucleotide 2'-phosphodiesterase (5'-nucleotidase family)